MVDGFCHYAYCKHLGDKQWVHFLKVFLAGPRVCDIKNFKIETR